MTSKLKDFNDFDSNANDLNTLTIKGGFVEHQLQGEKKETLKIDPKPEVVQLTNLETSHNASSVTDFYNGRSIFITGATGFLGKVLVWKLLKYCSAIKNVFVLIRPKKGITPSQRLSDLVSFPIFDNLSAEAKSKVCLIEGDITRPGLGISKEDEQLLVGSVSVIFHSAATVRFDEDFTKALEMNFHGTRYICELARKLKQLAAMVHVSTAYSHCYKEYIEEKFYKAENLDHVLQLCKLAEEQPSLCDVFNQPVATKALIGNHPNTYTFTKALAEQYLFESASDLPVAILRPSIVIASWRDPIPGWIDSINGPTGVILGSASGFLRSMLIHDENVADLIPVDIAINLMCVVASRIGLKQAVDDVQADQTIPVYHATTGTINPITWSEFREHIELAVNDYPMMCMMWYPGVIYQSNAWMHWICFLLMQKLPAFILDAFIRLFGFKPFFRRLVERVERTNGVLDYFVKRQWKWEMTNLERLEVGLKEKDRQIFHLKVQEIDWLKYIESYVYGVRTYVMKENPGHVRLAKFKMNVLWVLQHLFIATIIGGIITLLSFFDPTNLMGDFKFNWLRGLVCAAIIIYHG